MDKLQAYRFRNGDMTPDDTWSNEKMADVAPLSRIVRTSAIISRLGDDMS